MRPSGGFLTGHHRIHFSDIPATGVFDLAPEIGGDMYYTQDHDFIAGCLEGRVPWTSFLTALEVEKVIAAIYASARAQKPVALDGECP